MSLAYTDTAAGPTLVLLHAFPLDRQMWRPQLAALAGTARVIAPDLPGFGKSPLPPEGWTVDSAADDVAALLDTLGQSGRVVVGGLSMGGYVAMAFARRYPERLAGLILADTRAEPDDDTAKANREKLIVTAKSQGAAPVVDAMLPKLLGEETRAKRPGVADAVRAMGAKQAGEGVAAALAALRDRPDAGPGLDGLTAPLLVLVGEHDAVTPPTLAAAMAGRVYGSELVTVSGAGHLSNLENPDEFNAAVARFLAERTPAVKPATA
ncbi:alpha/beta fold hydrolase [Urbifossiella limnaea]|uniref:3-oxoadipate enol-lactonase 2 n=1 Tax=Urbifossiella limnaea TaxID=2528023 RepID=A0A517XXN5_9BACT|nr:alpha/beta fold hydrolase [Urbifossiella limnaea]QDU22241.1 3-oxoadipate enol-lactonase 2 [Urbifossiella limnaea]